MSHVHEITIDILAHLEEKNPIETRSKDTKKGLAMLRRTLGVPVGFNLRSTRTNLLRLLDGEGNAQPRQ